MNCHKSLYSENDSDSMEDCRSFEGLTCTCSKAKNEPTSTKLTNKKLLYIPFGNYKQFNPSQISSREPNQKAHNGSVSLSRILGDKRVEEGEKNPPTRSNFSHSYSSPFISSLYQHQRQPKDLTSSGSSRYGSPDASPEGFEQSNLSYRRPEFERKLTAFERDNILYIQELKEKQREALQNLERQVKDLPNFHFPRNSYNESILYDSHPLDETAPRGGSPFPRRKEYPSTAFSPSKAATSKALRSISLEEETEEEDLLAHKKESRYQSDNAIWSNLNGSYYDTKGNAGGRKMYPTPPSESNSFNTWWTNLPPSPNSMSPLNSPSFRRKSNSSLSSYSKSSAPSQYRTASAILPNDDTSYAKRKFSYRSLSSPAASPNRKAFDPQDLSLSFVNFEELPKCRPELEDVGGHVGSILSSSSSEEISTMRAMLPPTVETHHEDFSDEDTAKRNQQLEAKTVQQNGGESVQKSTQNSSSSNPPSTPSPVANSAPKPSSPPTQPYQKVTNNGVNNAELPKTPTTEVKKPSPMAFTVDFESANSDSSGSGTSAKKLEIAASISQWAPKHRRNLSLTKVDEHKKVEERQGSEKPPLGRPRSGTVGAGPPGTKRGGAGYHSEGYFSSDQDDEGPKRADLKSPRTPKTPDTVQGQPMLVRSNSQDSSKGNTVRMRPPSPLSPTSPYGAPLNETASFLIEKMMNATPETKRKFSTKPEGRSCCKERERKPSVSELTGKSYRTDKKMGSDGKKQVKNAPVDDFDQSKDDKDDVSETGTYTIDKDSPTPEEDQARNDIDGVFGITTESEAEMTSTTTTAVPMSTTDQCQEDESSWLSSSEIPPTISRNSPNWIQQWAAHVAEQTKPPINSISPHAKSSVASPRGHKLPLTSQDNNDSRPRRKLPTPPSHLSTTPTGLSQRSDPSSTKHRLWHDSTMYSDLTSDTEGYLRDTENIVTSLQARVDKTKVTNPAFRNTSFESHESGGDSDFDTSTSYPFNDDERMSASLKSKLRLTGLMPQSKNITSPSAGITSPRRPDGGASLDSKLKARDPSFDVYNTRRDERALHSDSSSEASEPYKDVVRNSDNNPPLKFNRAFSLRRARLGCDDPVTTSSPIDKKKANRASSAGTVGPSRKGNLGTSKSYQSVDSASVSSPRSYGYGSPRGIASPSQNVGGSKGTSQSDNFDRTDGGRYSLRLPRSGSTSIGLAKSPSKSNIKKDSSNHKKNPTRSNSTLSSKEVDFQNWKRRKNYDPMKAAAEGRKKQVEKIKGGSSQQSVQNNSDNRSPSPPGSLLRSASFHGTEGVMCNLRWNRKHNNIQPHYTSEDDGPYSLEEDIGPHPSPRHGSPLHRSPTSPHQLCQSPSRHPPVRGRRPSLGHSDEGESQYQSTLRKVSLEESGSEGKRSPLNNSTRGGSGNVASGTGRPKTKMEALDNLVISTIHSLSVKVRTTSESLLQKLKSQYDEEGDRAALLEEVLSHLSESDQSLTSGQTRSTSRELAGILRNLKKIEHALEVIDRVIIVGEEDYRDDDVDYVPTEWVEESDY